MSDDLDIAPGCSIPQSELAYSFSRSGGPGGQHVNTTDTRVRLRWAMEGSTAVSEAVKVRLRDGYGHWLTTEGDLQLSSDGSRSRQQNVQDARERLAQAIRACLTAPKRRKPTRPSKGSKERRLASKKQRRDIKRSRGRVRQED